MKTVYATDQWLLENYQDVAGNYNSDYSVDTDDMEGIYLAGEDENELPDEWNIIGIDEDSYFTADEDIEASIATALRKEINQVNEYVKMANVCELAGVSYDTFRRPERVTPTTRIAMYKKVLNAIKGLGN